MSLQCECVNCKYTRSNGGYMPCVNKMPGEEDPLDTLHEKSKALYSFSEILFIGGLSYGLGALTVTILIVIFALMPF